ncbi:MAG: GH32 C-terminal domain-containing protein [Muribaculaceae bacterium]|nr:GH32 C-terminal domain-containing protein [Muribaculaceae bacterium]
MKKTTSGIVAAAIGAVLALPAIAAADGVEIEHLGVNHTLVRVPDSGKYLMLPVQDANDDARINVLVDGRLDRTVNVRLAKSKTDYMVPFDLSPYKGRNVVLSVITSQDRSSVREAKGDACWTDICVADTFCTANREKFRPVFHHTPLYGWMNDPNGMFYSNGVWHLYYQYNPYGSKWQNLSWGHSTSTDLINWHHEPVALEPTGLGMVFSGSCAVDSANTAGFGPGAVVGMYTSADASQMQSLVWSNDGGKTFEFFAANPVITLETEARDPNMFWDSEHQRWVLTLAHALEHEMLVFTSPDMKQWTLQSSFGKGLGAQDGVWECPDLFKLPVAGTGREKWVLVCNLNPGGIFGGSATQYFIGDFDGSVFTADTDASGQVPVKWLDYGKDHYATVSWSDAPDGRRTVIGWMSNWQYAAEVPTLQYRSANTLPREIGLFEGPDGQIYASSTPSPELLALRGRPVVHGARFNVGQKGRKYALPAANGGVCEIVVDFEAREAAEVCFELANGDGEKVAMVYDTAARTLSFDRRQSGLVDFSKDFPAVTVAPTFETDGKISLRIFVDRSSVEVFGNDGRFAMTNLVFPQAPYTGLTVWATGGKARVGNLTIYPVEVK